MRWPPSFGQPAAEFKPSAPCSTVLDVQNGFSSHGVELRTRLDAGLPGNHDNMEISWRVPGLPLRVLSAAALALRLPQKLRTAVVWGSAGATAAGIGLYFWLAEGGFADSVFALAVTLACRVLIGCLCRRVRG